MSWRRLLRRAVRGSRIEARQRAARPEAREDAASRPDTVDERPSALADPDDEAPALTEAELSALREELVLELERLAHREQQTAG